jgi:hypothetical protein
MSDEPRREIHRSSFIVHRSSLPFIPRNPPFVAMPWRKPGSEPILLVMNVSTFRLWLLRAMYLMIAIFLTTQIWPALVSHAPAIGNGAGRCLLAAMAPLVILGLRDPLKMLPILLFELIWKSLWLIFFGWPAWSAHHVDPDTWESIKACGLGVVLFPIVIPWGYVFTNYFRPFRMRNATVSP